MLEISAKSVNIYLDFNAVIVNLDSLSPQGQKTCVENIEKNIKHLKAYLVENMNEKENMPNIPETGKAVMRQQFLLIQALEDWVAAVKS